MGCRVRENPDHIIECLVEVSAPKDNDSEPEIVRVFPEDYDDEGALKQIPGFCFPVDTSSYSPAGQLFTFVLTELDGTYRFGFCRHPPGAQTCLCILSYLPWFEIFYKFLNTLGELMCKKQDNDAIVLVDALHSYPVPEPTTIVTIKTRIEGVGSSSIPITDQDFSFATPDPQKLPTIPESRNITEYYNAVDLQNMMILFASLFYERRVLVTSKKLSLLTAIIHGAATLLYPLYWQHIFIPVIPSKLLDYCCAPMPFLIGVHSSLMAQARKKAAEQTMEIVILDADNNTIETPFDDLESLPSDITEKMKHRLKKTERLLDDGVARIFLKALVPLLGAYRQALRLKQGENITFDPDIFVLSKSSSMRRILEKMMAFQHFRQFIEGRLDMLNSGKGFNDLFEEECDLAEQDKDKMKIMYRQWIKDTRNVMNKMTSKANPAMRQMYKQTKKKMIAMQNRFSHPSKSKEVEDIPRSSSLQYLDTTDSSGARKSAPSSPTRARIKPERPPPPKLPAPYETYVQSQTRNRTKALHGSENQKFKKTPKDEVKSYNTLFVGDTESVEDSSSEEESSKGEGHWQLMDEFDHMFQKLDRGLLNTNSDSSVQRGQYRHSVPTPLTRQTQRSTNDAFCTVTSTNTPKGCPKADEEAESTIVATSRSQWQSFDDNFSTQQALQASRKETEHGSQGGDKLIDLASNALHSRPPTVKRQPPVVPPRPVSFRKSVVKIEVTATSPTQEESRPPPPASLIDSPLPLSFSSPQLTCEDTEISPQRPNFNSQQELLAEYGLSADNWRTPSSQRTPSASSFNNPAYSPSNQPQPLWKRNLPDLVPDLQNTHGAGLSGSAPVLVPSIQPVSPLQTETDKADPFADLVSETRASVMREKTIESQKSNQFGSVRLQSGT